MSANKVEPTYDQYDEYNYDDKIVNGQCGGKNRTKKESAEHTNHHDPSGHSRKILTKLVNTEANKKKEEKP